MAKKEQNTEAPVVQKDDALFEALDKNKKKKRRKIIITVVAIVLVVAILAVIGVSFLQKQVREQFATTSGEVISYAVTLGSISTTVSGSGSLVDVDLESVTVPSGVEITKVMVKTNQSVSAGDVLATVAMASVISAMADLQSQIEELDQQLSNAEEDAAGTAIYAGLTGRVKAVFGQKDAEVADVMFENGALALLSLDGWMSVTLETDALAAGDTVTVIREDGTPLEGSVAAGTGGKVKVLVTDDGPRMDEEVTVQDLSGATVGSGKLYIHNALAITGYAGTVNKIVREENAKVWAGTQIITLKDTTHTANYDALLRSRGDLEETLLDLLKLQKHGGITATVSGTVFSVQDLVGYSFSAEGGIEMTDGISFGFRKSAETRTAPDGVVNHRF